MTLPGLLVIPVSAAAVTSYHFPAPPIASAGSLGPGQSVSFKLTVLSGTALDPGGTIYLYYAHTKKGDSTTVPAAQCGGVTQVSLTASSPTHCSADAGGRLLITFTVAAQPEAQGGAEFIAENSPSNPTAKTVTHYAYSTVYRFVTSPIARSGSLGAHTSVPVVLTSKSGLDTPIPGSPVYLEFRGTAGGGSASVGSTPLTGTATLFTSDGSGVIQITYTTPAALLLTGQDSIVVEDSASAPTEVNSDTYAFGATTPVISTGDVTVTEGDQSPSVPAKFTVTVSPEQPNPVTVQYTTMCGIGDQGCEGRIPDDFNSVVTPATVTIPANTGSTTVNVPQFSYTGGHGGESYNESWFIKLENPTGAVLGRSVGEGLLLPDVEGTPAVLPYLYAGGASLVPTLDPGGEPLYFTVTLGADQKTAVTFSYSTASGSAIAGVDFIAVAGTASIPAGKVSAIIPVTLTPNSPPSSAKTFSLTISGASAGVTISPPTGTGTILPS
jgi:hypothetical protein